MARRFSKSVLAEYLTQRIDYLERMFKIDPQNGTAQLNPRDVDCAVAYGEREALLKLAEKFDLTV